MNKRLHHFILLLVVALSTVSAWTTQAQTPTSTTVVDEEYTRYKKQGDDFFKTGNYLNARRQYQNCLDVPGFENDTYVKSQIDKCTTGISLNQQAESSRQQGNNSETLRMYAQLLTLNPNDAMTKMQLTDYYEREGNKFFTQKRYLEAKTNYTEARKYATATKEETLSIQLATIDKILFPPPSKHIGLKLFTGAVAIGAGAYAFLLRNDYQSKMRTLSQISLAVDPSSTGIIDNPDSYRQYSDAYTAAEAAQQKNGLFRACVGVAAVATVAELYLLIHKPRAKSAASALQWQPSSQSWGLAVSYTF